MDNVCIDSSLTKPSTVNGTWGYDCTRDGKCNDGLVCFQPNAEKDYKHCVHDQKCVPAATTASNFCESAYKTNVKRVRTQPVVDVVLRIVSLPMDVNGTLTLPSVLHPWMATAKHWYLMSTLQCPLRLLGATARSVSCLMWSMIQILLQIASMWLATNSQWWSMDATLAPQRRGKDLGIHGVLVNIDYDAKYLENPTIVQAQREWYGDPNTRCVYHMQDKLGSTQSWAVKNSWSSVER